MTISALLVAAVMMSSTPAVHQAHAASKQLAADSSGVTRLLQRAGGRHTSAQPLALAFPVVDVVQTRAFGKYPHAVLKKAIAHNGVDYKAPVGTAVKAAAAGKVIYSGWYGGYGKVVILEHGNGYATLYCHLAAYDVAAGERVKAGREIGHVGSTGMSTGPHLHFELRRDGTPIDPAKFLPRG